MEKRILEKVAVIEITLLKGDVVPNHVVSSEVLACVVKGEVEFSVGEEKFVKHEGEFMHIMPNIEHDLSGITDSIVNVVRIGGK